MARRSAELLRCCQVVARVCVAYYSFYNRIDFVVNYLPSFMYPLQSIYTYHIIQASSIGSSRVL